MSAIPSIDELVPHTGAMRLIDRVVASAETAARAETVIRAESLFFRPGEGVPAYVGLELMAQTISAFDGLRRRRQGLPPAIGFLLGCRRYETTRPLFRDGERLTIEAKSLLDEGGMASFDCVIADETGAAVASGVINVYRPADPDRPESAAP
jgi:predicted hotdog family 3-hydroxylacyl-ACP dehydratase